MHRITKYHPVAGNRISDAEIEALLQDFDAQLDQYAICDFLKSFPEYADCKLTLVRSETLPVAVRVSDTLVYRYNMVTEQWDRE